MEYFRDTEENGLKISLKTLGSVTSIKAELKAVLCGLNMARDMGLKKILLWADSMIVVGMLRGNRSWNPIHMPLITQCKQLIARDDREVKVSSYYWEANQVADKLANLGIDTKVGVMYFDSPSKEIFHVLQADLVGAVWHRNVK